MGPSTEELRREAVETARGLAGEDTALARVLQDLERERERAAGASAAVVRSLTAALEARDGFTGEHCGLVQALSAAAARQLALTPGEVAEVETAALLHDVGKIGVPDAILHKPGPLDPAERARMREHPLIGERILRPLPGLEAVAIAVRHENEHFDGSGYPDGLSGEAIPLSSRVVLACDAYAALVSDRPYRVALDPSDARAELLRCAGTQFDPRVVDALLICVERGEALTPDPEEGWSAWPEPAGEEQRRLGAELRALISIASAVAAAHRVDEVVRLAAEHALEALGAASLSISRFDPERGILKTLINVGELGPGEERLPSGELYRLSSGDLLRGLFERGEPYVGCVEDPELHPLERELLESLGKRCCVAVPIMFAGVPWGEIWATRSHDQSDFSDRDARFLEAISSQIATAVGRAELFSSVHELAFRDGLTSLMNRRAFDDQIELSAVAARQSGTSLAAILVDLDHLKELNDARGHETGDAALRHLADTLVDLLGPGPGGHAYRLGGDEFCVLLEDADVEQARSLAEAVLARLREHEGSLSASCGVAALVEGEGRSGDLVRAADAALYAAKQGGRGRVCIADASFSESWRVDRSTEPRGRRTLRDAPRLDVGGLLAGTLPVLDEPLASASPLERLKAVMSRCAQATEASGAALSHRARGESTIETLHTFDWRTGRVSTAPLGSHEDVYESRDYSHTAWILDRGGSFVVEATDPRADPTERALLEEWGLAAVVLAAGSEPEGSWLIEIYGDSNVELLEELAAPLRLLMGHALRSPPRSAHGTDTASTGAREVRRASVAAPTASRSRRRALL